MSHGRNISYFYSNLDLRSKLHSNIWVVKLFREFGSGYPEVPGSSIRFSSGKGELMARVNRTRGIRVSASKHISTSATPDLTSKKRRRRSQGPAAPFEGMEALESRLMLTVTPSIVGGVLTCTGTTGEANAIS